MAYTAAGNEMIKAARALSDLNLFGAITVLLESSLVTSDCHEASAKILRICNAEINKCLRRHETAIKKAGGGTYGL